MWGCEKYYSSEVIWSGNMSLGKLRGNGEMRNKRHRHTELTKHRRRQWQEMNLTSHSNWWAVKAGSTSRKIHLDFGTDKTENWQRLRLGRVGEWMELYRPMGDVQEKGEQGGTKTKVVRKGCERVLFCVNQHRLVCSSGWAPAPDHHYLSCHLINSFFNDLSA